MVVYRARPSPAKRSERTQTHHVYGLVHIVCIGHIVHVIGDAIVADPICCSGVGGGQRQALRKIVTDDS